MCVYVCICVYTGAPRRTRRAWRARGWRVSGRHNHYINIRHFTQGVCLLDWCTLLVFYRNSALLCSGQTTHVGEDYLIHIIKAEEMWCFCHGFFALKSVYTQRLAHRHLHSAFCFVGCGYIYNAVRPQFEWILIIIRLTTVTFPKTKQKDPVGRPFQKF